MRGSRDGYIALVGEAAEGLRRALKPESAPGQRDDRAVDEKLRSGAGAPARAVLRESGSTIGICPLTSISRCPRFSVRWASILPSPMLPPKSPSCMFTESRRARQRDRSLPEIEIMVTTGAGRRSAERKGLGRADGGGAEPVTHERTQDAGIRSAGGDVRAALRDVPNQPQHLDHRFLFARA